MSAVIRSQLRKPFLSLSKRYLTIAMDTTPPGSFETSMREKLVLLLRPTSLTISNDSWQHRHHAPMREQGGGNGNTHFSIQIVSDAFKGKSTLQRHRMIYSALSEELSQGLHALTLKTKTEDEVEN